FQGCPSQRSIDATHSLLALVEEPNRPRRRANGIIEWVCRHTTRRVGFARLREEARRLAQATAQHGVVEQIAERAGSQDGIRIIATSAPEALGRVDLAPVISE